VALSCSFVWNWIFAFAGMMKRGARGSHSFAVPLPFQHRREAGRKPVPERGGLEERVAKRGL